MFVILGSTFLSTLCSVFFFFLYYYYSVESERDESEGCTPCKEQRDKERVKKVHG